MYISKIRVKNYKSFLDSGDIEFKPGINIIVGQNNSGKTALLEVLELNFFDLPHKSEKSLPKQGQRLRNQASESEVTFKLIPKELNLIRADNEFSTIFLRMPIQNHSEHIETIIDKFNHSLDEGLNITIDLKSRRSNPESNAGFDSLRYGFYEPDPNPNRNTKYLALKISEEKKYQLESKTQHLPQGRSVFGLKLYKDFKRKFYRFHAERVNLGSCEAGLSRDLVSDCQNLAEVLQNTQTRNSWLYEEFNKYVSQVYDSVKWLNSISQTVSNAAGDEKQFQQIFIWNIDRKTEREDLAIPLSQCGTGIGQVLAILYIVVTSREPRTIIIDEPNSFLHPGAAKKLIQILNKFPQHQYFISTHSPEILSACKTFDNYKTEIY
jgi:predicted ATP-dependent endonuclease of OLD family